MRERRYFYSATVTDVYDGDTITCDIDLGFGVGLQKQKIRLFGINTPEVRGPERPRGLVVRDWLRDMILGKTILLNTISREKKGKYGRWLGVVMLGNKNINKQLVKEGHAVEAEY